MFSEGKTWCLQNLQADDFLPGRVHTGPSNVNAYVLNLPERFKQLLTSYDKENIC